MDRYAYERDSYLTELDTEVVEGGVVDNVPFAVTADTLFYPEGGGQPADRGTIGAAEVTDVQRRDGRILHCLSAPLEHGPVRQHLDWPRRWDHMQQHTGQHVLTAVADSRFGWATTSFHLGPETSDVELAVAAISAVDLRSLEDEVAAEIVAARPVSVRHAETAELEGLGARTRGLPEGHSGSVRLVEIAGLDLNTCGGTHVRSTAEIGALCLLGTERLRGGTRVFFVAGDRVRRRLAAHEERNTRLRELLGAPDDELADLVAARSQQLKEQVRDRRKLLAELADMAVSELVASAEVVAVRHWPERDMAFAQLVARRLVEADPTRAVLLTTGAQGCGCFVMAAGSKSGVDVAQVGPAVAEVLHGRGGGAGAVFQGKAGALDRRDEALRLLASRRGG